MGLEGAFGACLIFIIVLDGQATVLPSGVADRLVCFHLGGGKRGRRERLIRFSGAEPYKLFRGGENRKYAKNLD
jgi:hypothetical protein